MARRVALALALALTATGSPGAASQPGLLERAGFAEALLGRWERALSRLHGADRASTYFRASALLALGMPEQALGVLRELSTTPGAFSGPALELAVTRLFDAGDHAQVVAWADTSLADRFQDPHALRYAVGQSRYLLGDAAGARQDLERVERGGRRPYALHTLALIHFQEGRLRDAVDLLGTAIEAAGVEPGGALGAALADRLRLTRGRVLYQAAVGLPELAAQERGRLFSLAREQFGQVKPGSPEYAGALRGIGWCSAEMGDSARALGAFEAAGALDPRGRHEDLWAQGRVYQRLGFHDEAARFYGEAREAAFGEAKAPGGDAPGSAVPDARRWADLGRRAVQVRQRAEGLAVTAAEVEAALGARDHRLERVAGVLGERRAVARARLGELEELAARLAQYMDEVPAHALFPPAARPRLHVVSSRQEELALQIARTEATFSVLGGSELWDGASPALQSRGRALWGRLGAAGDRLAQAQLAFLETLKGRVSEREAELSGAISSLGSATRGLAEPAAELERRLALALAGQEVDRARLAPLRTRLDDVTRRLRGIEADAETRRRRAGTAAAAREAERLRLRADAIALDEAQALHLWREERAGPRGGVRP
ncbi:MAG: hypothetical protein AB1578_15795 [Thermodesulfobacteriota bacterium]